MIGMVTLIVVGAIGLNVYVSRELFEDDSLRSVQETNRDWADGLADQSFSIIREVTEKMSLMGETLAKSGKVGEVSPETAVLLSNVLYSADEIISFGVFHQDKSGTFKELYFISKDEILAGMGLKIEELKEKPQAAVIEAISKQPNEVHVLNSSPSFGKPVLTVCFLTLPSKDSQDRWLVRSEFRQDQLISLFGKKKKVEAFMVNHKGHLIVHSNPELVIKGYDYSAFPIVKKFLEGQLNNHQMEFQDPTGKSFLGAFKSLGTGGMGVVAQVSRKDALVTVEQMQRQAIAVTVIVIGVAFILIYLFSIRLTSPIKVLHEATEKMSKGEFDLKLMPSSSDEIGSLTYSFKRMAEGLKERDKLKMTFNKFHSRGIAEQIMSGHIRLGGERKVATVFFSDIRGFTSLSEKMTPDEVVRMLNEYLGEMVKIIDKHKGIVDKYVGDAIMAVWGVPKTAKDDAYNAVSAALEMRKRLIKFNERRRTRNLPEIHIGMGLHTGEVLSGNIGSDNRLEYTVIGDTVNQSSRIESANKEFESDLLISDVTAALVKDRGFVFGPPLTIKVKGKTKALTLHQVIGKMENGKLDTVLTEEQQSKINNYVPVESEENTSIVRPSFSEKALGWYLVTDTASGETEGPYSTEQIRALMRQPGFRYMDSYLFKEGDAMMTPLHQVPEFARKSLDGVQIQAPLPTADIQREADAEHWYMYGDENTTYGPFSVDQLQQALDSGNISRTTYVWRQGMPNWIYVFQIPGFDRRAGQKPVNKPSIPAPSIKGKAS